MNNERKHKVGSTCIVTLQIASLLVGLVLYSAFAVDNPNLILAGRCKCIYFFSNLTDIGTHSRHLAAQINSYAGAEGKR
jgi:hypothetical protein